MANHEFGAGLAFGDKRTMPDLQGFRVDTFKAQAHRNKAYLKTKQELLDLARQHDDAGDVALSKQRPGMLKHFHDIAERHFRRAAHYRSLSRRGAPQNQKV